MARKDLLPSYLSQQAWRDLFDAVDLIFKSRVDTPVANLGKLRMVRPLTDTIYQKIEDGVLFSNSDLEIFEKTTSLKQIGLCGLLIRTPGYFTETELSMFFKNIARFWYSKGTGGVADFISYVLGIDVRLKRLWTDDYVNFLPEGDAGIGTPIYNGGAWYPTTHTVVEIEAVSLPGGISLELFAQLIEELINYPLVPQYVLMEKPLVANTLSGPYLYLEFDGLTVEHEFLATFALTSGDQDASNGGGGFETMEPVALPGPGGTGYTPPSPPVADFTASVTSGTAPLSVTFNNTSTGPIVGSGWDIGDNGSIDSSEFSPTFLFSTPGVYTVKLIVFNEAGADFKIRSNYITVNP